MEGQESEVIATTTTATTATAQPEVTEKQVTAQQTKEAKQVTQRITFIYDSQSYLIILARGTFGQTLQSEKESRGKIEFKLYSLWIGSGGDS